MKEITQDNYKDLEFNFYGIIIARRILYEFKLL
jgi:hypothetical protein